MLIKLLLRDTVVQYVLENTASLIMSVSEGLLQVLRKDWEGKCGVILPSFENRFENFVHL